MVKGTIPTATDRGKGKNSKPGPFSEADLGKELWRALKYLDDPFELDASRLTKLKGIDVLAQKHYHDATFSKGEVVKAILSNCIVRLSKNEESKSKLYRCCYLIKEIARGSTLLDVSRQLGLRREYVSREYRSRAMKILVREFMAEVDKQIRD